MRGAVGGRCRSRPIRSRTGTPLLKAVTLKEIERIFSVIEPLGISREAVVIPLRPEHPGRVRLLGDGKLEIVVDSQSEFEDWLSALADRIGELMDRQAG